MIQDYTRPNDGDYIEYHKNGKISLHSYYKNGKLQWKKKYYSNGRMATQWSRKDDPFYKDGDR